MLAMLRFHSNSKEEVSRLVWQFSSDNTISGDSSLVAFLCLHNGGPCNFLIRGSRLQVWLDIELVLSSLFIGVLLLSIAGRRPGRARFPLGPRRKVR